MALLMSALFCVTAAAQDAIRPPLTPDAFVRGAGIAALAPASSTVSAITPAMFRIDVARLPVANVPLRGGFYIRELSMTTSIQRMATIVSRQITGLEIVGNTAVIRAQGTYNGRAACLTLEVLDDNPSGDWISVKADGCLLTVIYYAKAGGVKQGDIKVWEKPEVVGFTKGFGSIAVPRSDVKVPNVGNFEFVAENTNAGVRGKLVYREMNPLIMAPVNRPVVELLLPAVQKLEISGNAAMFHGEGTLTMGMGPTRPVDISVVVRDNRRPLPVGSDAPTLPPDEFAIYASDPLVPSLLPLYQAKGPLTRGDIIVGAYSITPQ